MVRSVIKCVPFDSWVCYHLCDMFIVWFYSYQLVDFAVVISACPYVVELFGPSWSVFAVFQLDWPPFSALSKVKCGLPILSKYLSYLFILMNIVWRKNFFSLFSTAFELIIFLLQLP